MAVACSEISCGPDLAWTENENKGMPLLVHDKSSVNIPAIAAAHVIKRYIAQAEDELSFEVGDIVCIIDMPPKELSPWWRGKRGFQVGFFPGECVELINSNIPEALINSVPKPVPKKRSKLITFLRSFMKARPKKPTEREMEKESVFGCDLGAHLLHSGRDVPQVLQSCAEFIEQHGVVQGIYRLSGVASNIQRLRHEFESEQIPELTVRDIHSVSSLCKMYFRELPNPLLTHQLYGKFSDAVGAATEEEKLVRMQNVIQQLPAPHYRTLEYLMRHLACLAGSSSITNMHAKNLAIVWAPNLLRSQQKESACASGRATCMELQMQSDVVEFIINHTDILFCSKSTSDMADGAGHNSLSGPKPVGFSSAATKLLSLEEAQAQRRDHSSSPVVTERNRDIEVEEGPTAVQGKFHTVIDFPSERQSPPSKMRESPASSWCCCFSLRKSSSVAERQLQCTAREPSETEVVVLEGESNPFQPRRSRASSDDVLCASISGELFRSTNCSSSTGSLPSNNINGEKELIQVHALISPISAKDANLSSPATTVTNLDCNPVSLQCIPSQAQCECPDSSNSMQEQARISEEEQSLLEGDLKSGLQAQALDSSTSSKPLSP
ncbi:rho GTPase-activating protein 32-like [Phasianus colchicus]|uniref:rho GTPase-activating protein 32-like n=1 Tax=Phasianus colchicus TaxID=9054 RepID=UPI00129DD187|nr:rho GTPase-activating protein 32-like [Phasianus colchicus]